jgi:hypothetical protein
MSPKLVKAATIDVDGRSYPLRYYERRTARGARRYSCEVLFGGSDRIIIDGDSMSSLESRVERLAPATVYSRAARSRGGADRHE